MGQTKTLRACGAVQNDMVHADLLALCERLKRAKPDALVMHPGPMNRGVEIASNVADDVNRSVIAEQVEMGVAVRMSF